VVIGWKEGDHSLPIKPNYAQQAPKNRGQGPAIGGLHNLASGRNFTECLGIKRLVLLRQCEQHPIRMNGSGNPSLSLCKQGLPAKQWAKLLGAIVTARQLRQRAQADSVAPCQNYCPAVVIVWEYCGSFCHSLILSIQVSVLDCV
jgi:hypothetical protein